VWVGLALSAIGWSVRLKVNSAHAGDAADNATVTTSATNPRLVLAIGRP
jgi:hypothetical protein